MAQKQTAIVVVSKDWINTAGVRHLLNDGRKSNAVEDAHIVIAPIHDDSDHRGLWLKGVKTTYIVQDEQGSPVTMNFMIPWPVILALGVTGDEAPAVGYKTNDMVHVVGSSGPE